MPMMTKKVCPHCEQTVSAFPQTFYNHKLYCDRNPNRKVIKCSLCKCELKDLTSLRKHRLTTKHKRKLLEQSQPTPSPESIHFTSITQKYDVILADPPWEYKRKAGR